MTYSLEWVLPPLNYGAASDTKHARQARLSVDRQSQGLRRTSGSGHSDGRDKCQGDGRLQAAIPPFAGSIKLAAVLDLLPLTRGS